MKSLSNATFLAAMLLWLTMACPAQAIDQGTQKPFGSELEPNEYTWGPDKSPTGPVGVIVDLKSQTLSVYRDGKLIGRSSVSTGTKSHPTAPGTYTILTKNVTYHSKKYHEVSMPFMERLTWDGMAIHAGNNPGKPSSHGCIHVPLDFAEKLYSITQTGNTVLISDLDREPGKTVNPGLVPLRSPEPAPDPKSKIKVPRGGPAPKDVSPDATPIPAPTTAATPAAQPPRRTLSQPRVPTRSLPNLERSGCEDDRCSGLLFLKASGGESKRLSPADCSTTRRLTL